MLAYSPGPELIVVAAVFVLLFGAKKLPELARSIGRSTTEFKRGMKDGSDESDEADEADEADEPAAQPPADEPAEKRAE
jgi:sec-independent protein translocase protein TatA